MPVFSTTFVMESSFSNGLVSVGTTSVAHAVAARPSVMTRANSKANKVFLLLFMCFTSIIRRYFSGAHSAK